MKVALTQPFVSSLRNRLFTAKNGLAFSAQGRSANQGSGHLEKHVSLNPAGFVFLFVLCVCGRVRTF